MTRTDTATTRTAAVADAQADLYGLLAAILDGETDVLATVMQDGSLVDVTATLPVDIDAAPLECKEVDEDALRIAYDNLFVVPGPQYVPPVASAHRDQPSEAFESDSPFHDEGSAGELLGDPASEMSSLYDRAGVRPSYGDFPDHVAAQLEFLAAVTRLEAQALETGTDDRLERFRTYQHETLEQLGWLDTFHRAVAATDGPDGVFTALVTVARTITAWHARDYSMAE
ncbi:Nitrate reductase delta subunit [Halobiforma haloterrestris]|uniref:Nitrate reductase delta subunit n=1 Tax=Natronobacterium haloterrestre TaxID=148448 RepID=A0A1I1L9B6_NATHA|nr:molecular chaperone TorD family protein [Halobiforma haloterrestris]SFC69596.1 Nitrate reductase delta subunit [Halobiforma haloterrestris]